MNRCKKAIIFTAYKNIHDFKVLPVLYCMQRTRILLNVFKKTQKVFFSHQVAFLNMAVIQEEQSVQIPICYGFAWQGFGSRAAIGVASVRSCEKLPPSLKKPVPDGSKMDLPLAKLKAISDSGSSSGIAYLRKGRKTSR